MSRPEPYTPIKANHGRRLKMADIYKESEYYRKLAEEVLEEHAEEFADIREFDAKIGYLTSTKVKKRSGFIVNADCRKVAPEYRWCCHYDFLITVYEESVKMLTREQKKVLMWHELKHVGIQSDGEEKKLSLIPHDVQDFSDIIKSKGINWSSPGYTEDETEIID